MNTEDEPVKIFEWCEGYDAEYEYTVTIYKDRIHWHLQFDPQWTDPPKDIYQSINDFLIYGTPSDFNNKGSSEEVESYIRAMDIDTKIL